MTIPEPQVFSDLSEQSLLDLRLTALNRAANIRKAIARELEMWVEEWALAALVDWMLKNRDALHIRPEDAPALINGLVPFTRSREK